MAKPKHGKRPAAASRSTGQRTTTGQRTPTAKSGERNATSTRNDVRTSTSTVKPVNQTTGTASTVSGVAPASIAANGAHAANIARTTRDASRAANVPRTKPATRLATSGAAAGAVDAKGTVGRGAVPTIRERTAARKRFEQKRSWWQVRKVPLGVIGSALLIVVILLVVAHNQPTGSGVGNVDPNVLHTITTVSPTTFEAVNTGGVPNPMIGLPTAPVLTQNGKPEVLYIGAEYCPYCAAERWSLVIALSRFGTFQGLNTMTSQASDYAGSTNTFTFVKASYTSKYITFVSKETEDRAQNPLQSLTSQEQSIFNQYDAPPYTASTSAGGIPFIDFGNQYETLSSGYDPSLLHAGAVASNTPLTWQQIAGDLSTTGNPVTQAIIGNANYLTAAICKLTNNQPSSVCQSTVIQQIEAKLPKHS